MGLRVRRDLGGRWRRRAGRHRGLEFRRRWNGERFRTHLGNDGDSRRRLDRLRRGRSLGRRWLGLRLGRGRGCLLLGLAPGLRGQARLANLAHAIELLRQAPRLLHALTRQLVLVRSLGTFGLALACQQGFGLGALLLGLLDQAARLLRQPRMLLRGLHLFSLAPGAGQHFRFVRPALLGSAPGRLGGFALGFGGLARGLCLQVGGALLGFCRLALGVLLLGRLGLVLVLLLGCVWLALRLRLGLGAVRSGKLLGHLVRGIVGPRRRTQHQPRGDQGDDAARNRPSGHCPLLNVIHHRRTKRAGPAGGQGRTRPTTHPDRWTGNLVGVCGGKRELG